MRLKFVFALLFLTFSVVHAQSDQQTSNQTENKITVIGNAQIFSADASFNEQISKQKIKLLGSVVKIQEDKQLLVVTSVEKKKNFSEKAKIAQKQTQEKVTKEVLAKINKAKEQTQKLEFFTNSSSGQSFSNLVNVSKTGFILPDAQKHSQNSIDSHITESSVDFVYYDFKQNNSFYSSVSKTSGYSERFSVRPPPVLL